MNVADILATKGSDVATISPDRPVVEALDLLAQWGIGALVVTVDGHTIDGMLSERDVVRHLATEGAAALHEPVHVLMSVEVLTCSTTDRTDGLMAQMTERRVRHLPVTDVAGDLCGIVSIGDVVKSRVSDLEAEHAQLVDYVRSGL